MHQDLRTAPEAPADEILAADEAEHAEHEEQSLGWLGWVISGSVHLLVLVLFAYLVFGQLMKDEPPAVVRAVPIPAPPKPPEQQKPRDLIDKPEVPIVKDIDVPAPISQLDIPVTETEREEDNDNPVPKGRNEANADSEMGSNAAFMAIGPGGGAGMFGDRTGDGRKRGAAQHGGSRESESAVEAALRWLKKHQSPNGMWDAVGYPTNCTEDPKCEPGSMQNGDTNAALTGYAVLCFLGAGYDHKSPNKFRDTVKKGLEYLVSIQQADGRIGKRNYEQGVCAMAVAEAFAMTADADLKDPAQRSMNCIVAHQNSDPKGTDPVYHKLGWDYTKPNDRNDMSVTGWNVMALKSGLAAGLDIGNALDASKHMLKTIWQATNPNHASLDPYGESRFPYTYKGSSGAVDIAAPGSANKDLACVGMVCCVFLGHGSGDIMLETLANYVMKYQTPTSWADFHTYYTYYNTLGVFQVGGERWKKWNESVRDLLVKSQRVGDGCFDGSWNWADTKKWHGVEAGRVLSTVYCCLSLEVYYRYALVNKGKGKPAAPAAKP